MGLVLENRITLNSEYDQDDDTLYAWIGEGPVEAITYETEEGHLIRLDPETKEFVGVTIFDYEARWKAEGITLEWVTNGESERRVLHRATSLRN
jgi:hypothetical protein